MFDIPRQRLATNHSQLRFVHSDLSASGWASALGEPFDLAVSSIAIHNLYDLDLIAELKISESVKITLLGENAECFLPRLARVVSSAAQAGR